MSPGRETRSDATAVRGRWVRCPAQQPVNGSRSAHRPCPACCQATPTAPATSGSSGSATPTKPDSPGPSPQPGSRPADRATSPSPASDKARSRSHRTTSRGPPGQYRWSQRRIGQRLDAASRSSSWSSGPDEIWYVCCSVRQRAVIVAQLAEVVGGVLESQNNEHVGAERRCVMPGSDHIAAICVIGTIATRGGELADRRPKWERSFTSRSSSRTSTTERLNPFG